MVSDLRLMFTRSGQTTRTPCFEYSCLAAPTTSRHELGGNRTSFSPGNKLRKSMSAPLSICPTSISYIILCCKSFWMYPIATSLSVVVDMNPSSSPTLAPESVGFRKRSDTLRPAIPRYTLPPDGVGVMRLTLISALVMAWTVDTYGKSPTFLRASRSASCLIFFSSSTRSSGSVNSMWESAARPFAFFGPVRYGRHVLSLASLSWSTAFFHSSSLAKPATVTCSSKVVASRSLRWITAGFSLNSTV
mmetsp:Transcript_17093/g.41384  ORF Transcript_17093/g.41384 Transcript_17093/m.41384 type:complete len:247 (+) Transcript_17093:4591-5331(+)